MFTLAFKRNARAYLVLCMIFSCVFLLNCLTPLFYGDDYVYCFIWDGSSGWNIYEPLPEDARRVEGVADLVQSVSSYYMHWGGRLVGTALSQFFAWQGKELFNFCNSVIFLVLILEIHALSTGGKMVSDGKAFRLLWIFFALWSFVLGINGVMLWEIGACYYLWTMVLVLAFLIPYVRQFRSETETGSDSMRQILGMGLLGLLAGNTNENTICWLILLLGYDCVQSRREKKLQGWMVSGLAGLALGYLALIFSPGTIERMLLDVRTLGTQSFSGKLLILAAGFLFQFLLWHFVFRGWRARSSFGTGAWARKTMQLIRIECMLSFGMLWIMLLSPELPLRSMFPSTVFLIVAAATMVELMQRTGKHWMGGRLRRFLHRLGAGYMVFTMAVTLWSFYGATQYAREVDNLAEQHARSGSQEILEIPWHEESRMQLVLSGIHNTPPPLLTDEKDWKNAAYARYWGIKGIRMMEK